MKWTWSGPIRLSTLPRLIGTQISYCSVTVYNNYNNTSVGELKVIEFAKKLSGGKIKHPLSVYYSLSFSFVRL